MAAIDLRDPMGAAATLGSVWWSSRASSTITTGLQRFTARQSVSKTCRAQPHASVP
ncbi:hypothetical protein [Xanthomonas campestris]|uniref:hypothetical protein n=1 Tax=Xanthomonas campestris TaxID=339 RepID=UPI002B3DD493|nr:hypothetical protein [Xanthomonas campestris]